MMKFYFYIISLSLLVSTVQGQKINFNEQIRPLFNRNCTGCHGGVKQAGGLSLLYKESAFGKTHHGIGIVPGKPEESMIYKVITSPPEVFDKSKKKNRHLEFMPLEKEPLKKEEVELIRRWIEQGAHWEEHWSFIPPKPQTLPQISTNWQKNRLDYFTLEKMTEKKLTPSPQEEKGILLRRVYLDLIGIPPTINELKEFLADNSPNAYEKVVDKLLASPHYGEKWASMWMDLARYADTQGYEKDNGRIIYRFKDEVIIALNEDTPYNQFVTELMAGDLLPNPTLHQQILTAFHRNTMTNTEGGTDDEEFRVAAVIDRVNTTWEAFLGNSFNCVQCHTHPYDPFLHEEYYQFLAFFNNTADNDRDNEIPTISTPNAEQQKEAKATEQKLTELEKELQAHKEKAKIDLIKIYEKAKKETATTQSDNLTDINISSPTKHTVKIDDKGILTTEKNNENTAILKITGKSKISKINFIQLNVLPEGNFGLANNFLLSNISLNLLSNGKSAPLTQLSASATYEQPGFPVVDSLNDNNDKGWSVGNAPKTMQSAFFKLPKPIELTAEDKLEITLSFKSKNRQFIVKTFYFETGYTEADASIIKIKNSLAKNLENFNDQEKDSLLNYFLENSPAKNLIVEIDKLTKQKANFRFATTPIMQELPEGKRRITKEFNRGNWEDLGKVVTEGTPKIMNPFLSNWPKNRLGMAYWLTDKENPLFSRVAVNRLWEQIFGTGIVDSPEDFGSQGSIPSNQKLLDDLAYRFANEHKWSTKSLLKEMVTSATYRQSSNATEEMLEKDPANIYLARGPRFRLSSEQLRDQALTVSELLSKKMFGPPVMPYQPPGIWMSVYNSQDWVTSKNGEQYRRGVYTYWKRTSPYPSMETFDTPSREVCKVRRVRTNTPLQALVALNDPVFLECASAFGKLIQTKSSNFDEQITFAFEKALCRQPSQKEIEKLKVLHADIKQNFNKSEEETWALVAGVIMNLDEFLIKR